MIMNDDENEDNEEYNQNSNNWGETMLESPTSSVM
jgi:hypothetical protein